MHDIHSHLKLSRLNVTNVMSDILRHIAGLFQRWERFHARYQPCPLAKDLLLTAQIPGVIKVISCKIFINPTMMHNASKGSMTRTLY